MHDPCRHCPIRVNCDYLSGMCRLSPLEVARFRPELVSNAVREHQDRRRATYRRNVTVARTVKSGRRALGMKKYDRRFRYSNGKGI